jgi:hypothetical protein
VTRIDIYDVLGDHHRRPPRIRWRVRQGRFTVTVTAAEGVPNMALILTNAQKVGLSIQPLDQYGNPARVDGAPVWSVSDPTVGTITADASGLAAEFVTLGPVGVCQVAVQADADLGAGVRHITGTMDVQVEPSEAVSVGIVAGTPVQK